MASTAPVAEKSNANHMGQGPEKTSNGEQKRSAADDFLRVMIEEACNSLWWAEFTRACLQLVLLLIVAVGTWVLVDQWIFSPGNLVRWVSLGLLLSGIAFFFASRVLPLLGQSIRPEYAARSLETNFPELRQALTSYITLQNLPHAEGGSPGEAKRSPLRDRVLQSIGSATAGYLKQHNELPIEATSTIRWWVATLAALASFILYAALSPKNALPSVTRLAAPWASIDPSKRITISEVSPGDSSATSNEKVTVTARVMGLRGDDKIECRWTLGSSSTLDERSTSFLLSPDRSFTQTAPIQYYTGNLSVPENAADGLSYEIVAGDANAGPFRLDIKNIPVASLQSVKYEPPAYTLEPSFTRTTGAVSALDGTRVTILARTNRPMARATIEFNPKPIGQTIKATAGAIDMQIDPSDQTVSASLLLRLPGQRATSELRDSYRIRIWDEFGATNPAPIIYPIEIIADLAPEVAIMLPTEDPKNIPFNAQQIIAVHASDADYGLSQIRLQMRMGIQRLPDVVLWRNQTGETGNQIAEYRFRPNRLLLTNGDFLRPGQSVFLTAVAIDNRRVNSKAEQSKQSIAEEAKLKRFTDAGANATLTDSIELRIVAPEELPPPNQADEQGMSRQDERPASNPNAGEQQGNQNQNQSGGSDQASDSGDGKQSGSGQGGSESGASGSQSDQPSSSSEQSSSSGGKGAAGQNQEGQSESSDSQASPSNNDSSNSEVAEPNDGMSDGANSDSQNANPSHPSPAGSNSPNTNPDSDESAKPGDSQTPPADATGSESTNYDRSSDTSNSSTGQQGDSQNMSDAPSTPQDSTQPDAAQRDAAQQNSEPQNGSQQDPMQQGSERDPSSGGNNSQPSGNSSPSGSGQGESGGNQGKPQHDAEAFERIKDFLDQQEPGKDDQQGNKQPGSDQNPSPNPSSPKIPSRESAEDGAARESNSSDSDARSSAGSGSQDDSGSSKRPNGSDDPTGAGDPSHPGENESGPGESEPGDAKSGGAESSDAESGDGGMAPEDATHRASSGQEGKKTNEGKTASSDSNPTPSGGDDSSDADSDSGSTASEPDDSSKGESDPGKPSDTGQPSDASKTHGDNPSGDQPSKSPPPAEPSSGDSSKSPSAPGTPSASSPQSTDPSHSSTRSPTGNKPGANDPSGQSETVPSSDPGDGGNTPVDEINEDYTKKATDMVLDYLDETREQPDPDLLKQLDWTQQDLERFRNRWNNVRDMKPQGTADTPKSKEHQEALRSLGLRPPGKVSQSKIKDQADSLGPIRDSGNRIRPPAAHRDAFNAFRRSLQGKKLHGK